MKKQFLGSLLALSISAMPLLALADGINDYQLRPLNSSYTNSYPSTTPQYSNSNNNSSYNTGYTAQSQQTPLRGNVSTLPKGTTMILKLDQPLSSYSSALGENITATLENDLFVNGNVAIPAGSNVVGQVVEINRAGRMGRHGDLDVRFHQIKTPNGMVVPIQGHIITEDNTGRLKGNSFKVDLAKGIGVAAGGTGIGAVTGVALGGLLGVAGTGAVLGTGVGALAGIGYAVARKGKDVVMQSGTRMSIKVDEDINFNH